VKLCIVTHSLLKGDGQGRVNYEVAWEALRQGHQLTVIASTIDPELAQQARWVPVSVKGLPTELLRNLAFAWQSAQWLGRHRSEFDVLKVNGAITPVSGDINAAHFIHSSWLRSPSHTSRVHKNVYGLYQWLYTALNARWERQAFRQAKKVIAVSEKIRQELVEIGIPRDRIQVIVNGVNLQEFHPGKAERLKFGLPESVPLAFFAGDIRTPRKNLDTILQALTQVPELHLAVAGQAEESPYPYLSATLGLSQRVHFLGFRRDIAELMRSADLFVFPSRYEACTLVLLEAMASGLPVITATTTGGSELVMPDCGRVLQDAEDVTALAQALRELAGNQDLRQQMGRASRAIAERHSWKTMSQRYLDLFEQVRAA